MLKHLNERARKILQMVVEEYVDTGEPLGSGNISKRLNGQLSPATVRNVMADLQAAGLIHAPHTSAGRLPTHSGLRLFVEGILENGNINETDRRIIEKAVAEQNLTAELSPADVMHRAAQIMAGLSRCAGLIAVPKTDWVIRHLEFVALSQRQLMAVVVLEGGMVENIVLEMPHGVPMTALLEASNYLSTKLSGYPLPQAIGYVRDEIAEQRAVLDVRTRDVVERGLATLVRRQADTESLLIVRGHENLLDGIGGMEELEQIRSLFGVLERKENLLKILESLDRGEGVRIFIGAENELFALAGCSMIAASYGSVKDLGDGHSESGHSGHIVGTVGVIGPSRMNYARIIPLVDYTMKVIDRVMKRV